MEYSRYDVPGGKSVVTNLLTSEFRAVARFTPIVVRIRTRIDNWVSRSRLVVAEFTSYTSSVGQLFSVIGSIIYLPLSEFVRIEYVRISRRVEY